MSEANTLSSQEQRVLEQAFEVLDESKATRQLAEQLGAIITRLRGGYCGDECSECTCALAIGYRVCGNVS